MNQMTRNVAAPRHEPTARFTTAEFIRVHAEPVEGDDAEIRTVRFGPPLAVPGTDATVTLS